MAENLHHTGCKLNLGGLVIGLLWGKQQLVPHILSLHLCGVAAHTWQHISAYAGLIAILSDCSVKRSFGGRNELDIYMLRAALNVDCV